MMANPLALGSQPAFDPFAEELAARRKQNDGTKDPAYNMNPIAKRNAAESTVTAPKVDTLVAYRDGIFRGLKDIPAGLVAIQNAIPDPMEYFDGYRNAKDKVLGNALAINAADEAEYQQKYGDITSAGVGRFTGNAIPMLIPGMQGVRASSVLGNVANGAVVGAAQSAVIGGGRNPDGSTLNDALIGGAFGTVGATVGSAVPRVLSAVRGGARASNSAGELELVGNEAVRRLIEAGGGHPERLRNALTIGDVTYVPGAAPTTAQAAMLPGISQVQRTLRNAGAGNGAGALLDREALMETARLAHLDTIANTSGMTAADAAEMSGQQIQRQVGTDYAAAKQATRDAYNDPALQLLAVPTTGTASKIYNDAFTVAGQKIGGNSQLEAVVNTLDSVDSLPFADLQKLRAAASGIAHSASLSGDKNLARVASNVTDHIDGLASGNSLFDAAKAARRAQGETYETGWLRDLTRTGADNMPRISGAQIPRNAFTSGADQLERMQIANGALDAKSIDSLKHYAVADLKEKALRGTEDAPKLLANQVRGWTDKRSQALQELLTPDEFAAIQAIKRDTTRAASAEALGMATGSNTAQNILNSPVLDAPILKAVANKVPLGMGSAALATLQAAQKKQLAQELTKLMIDPKTADSAIEAYLKTVNRSGAGGRAGGTAGGTAEPSLWNSGGGGGGYHGGSGAAQSSQAQQQETTPPPSKQPAPASKQAPQKAIDYLKQNNTPEVQAAFKAKYGYLP